MRTRRISTATALAVLFSSVVLVGGAANPAAADSSAILPVMTAGDIVVDGVHQKIFISDPYSGKLVATDYAGRVQATLTGLPGVNGLALSADSGQLYAAVPGDDSIVSFETQTVTQTARYATGEGTDPESLALAGGKVWFGYGVEDKGNLGSLDLSAAEPVVTLGQDDASGWRGAPKLATTPGAPNTLAAGDETTSSGLLGVFDVATGSAVRTAFITDSYSHTKDLALTPDGSHLVTADVANRHFIRQTTDLAEVGTYPTEHYANGVAIASDGTVAAGSDSSYAPDVHVFKPGASTPVRQYDFPNTGTSSGSDLLADGGLAWEPNGSRLFAVSSNSQGQFSLRVLTEPTKSATTVTVNAPSTAARATKLTVTGKVASNTPFPAGARIAVTRVDMESPNGTAPSSVALKADGTFSFTNSPPSGGKVTYKVVYAGDATHSASSGSDSVAVSRAKTSLTLNRNKSVYSYGKDVTFTAHLGTTYKNRVVELWVDPFGADKPKKLVRTAKVNSSGNLSVVVDMKRDTAVTAVFRGDSRYAPKSVKSTAYARVKVSTSITKEYKNAKIGTRSYAFFHKTTNPVFSTGMSYYKGRSHLLSLQLYYKGTWYDVGSDYFKLGTSGRTYITLTGPHDTGYKMRVRPSYVNGYSGDSVNSTTHGSWKYFIFTK
ncbi:Ig-like domain repeat protein [Streptomyces sp. NPDC055749]